MNIRRTSWHARVYLWWYARKYGTPVETVLEPEHLPRHVNLCPYVRTVLFWAPLRFLFSDWATKWLPICVWPILLYSVPKLLGWLSYDAKMSAWILESIIGSVATVFFIIAMNEAYAKRDKTIWKTLGKWWDQSEERALLVAYGRAGHDRFCPEITLEHDEATANGKARRS